MVMVMVMVMVMMMVVVVVGVCDDALVAPVNDWRAVSSPTDFGTGYVAHPFISSRLFLHETKNLERSPIYSVAICFFDTERG